MSDRAALDPSRATARIAFKRTSGDADLTAQVSNVSFDVGQSVATATIAAAEDLDRANGSASFSLSAPLLSTVLVNAAEIDDDAATIVLSNTPPVVGEGQSAQLEASLDIVPEFLTTLSVSATTGAAITGAATLQFPIGFAGPLPVTTTGSSDLDASDDIDVTVQVSGAGLTPQGP